MSKKVEKKEKTTIHFKKSIEDYLKELASKDPVFKKKYKSKKKNIDDCITYILNTVQKSGVNGFTDAEVFGMATHYYDEEKIDVGKDIDMKVVVNHTVELTPEEIESAKKDAINKIHQETRKKMTSKKPKKTVKKEEAKPEEQQGSLF